MKIVKKFFNENPDFLVKHQVSSYNYFIYEIIPNIIKGVNPLIIKDDENREILIYYGCEQSNEIFYVKPFYTPNECRQRNLSYSLIIKCNILVKYLGKDLYIKDVIIGKIPLMVKSDFCLLKIPYIENDKNSVIKNNILQTKEKNIKHRINKECVYDKGGYFIIQGMEKVIVSQELRSKNTIEILEDDENFICSIGSIKNINVSITKWLKIFLHKKHKVITVHIRNVKVPLAILFRALGIETDKEIIEHIVLNKNLKNYQNILNILMYSIEDCIKMFKYNSEVLSDENKFVTKQNGIYDQLTAFKYLSSKIPNISKLHKNHLILDMLYNQFLPHMGNDMDCLKDKALFLGYMVNKLISAFLYSYDGEVSNIIIERSDILKKGQNLVELNPHITDIDNWSLKRVQTPGYMLGYDLFRKYYEIFTRRVINKLSIYKNFDILNESYIYINDTITDGFLNAFKGQWGPKSVRGSGLARNVQDLGRISYLHYISHVRRLLHSVSSDIKLPLPRRLHTSQWGYLCPCETPEGANIGIIKNLSVMCEISINCDKESLIKYLIALKTLDIKKLSTTEISTYVKVFVDGQWFGIHKNPIKLVYHLRLLRRNNYIDRLISIRYNTIDCEIYIFTDHGRVCRPLFIVNNMKINDYKNKSWDKLTNTNLKKKDFNEILEKNIPILEKNQCIIEYIDVNESYDTFISINQDVLKTNNKYSHCEIHPILILGALANMIPFAGHNQSPRNQYSTAHFKQAITVPITNFKNRLDTSMHILYYPQKPLVSTVLTENISKLHSGINITVAICTYSGFNQEDAIIFNKTSIERGLFRSMYLKTHKFQEETTSTSKIYLANPVHEFNKYGKKLDDLTIFDLLDKSGIIKLNTKVEEGKAILGACSINNEGDIYDSSLYIKPNDIGKNDMYVNNVKIMTKNTERGDAGRICKINLREERIPALGDKFASRLGQKGVIGCLLKKEDMPCTSDGLVPDIIINPYGFPKRMTLGQFFECVINDFLAQMGKTLEVSTFSSMQKEILNKYEDKVLYSGLTGKKIQAKIFMGPIYYQRLKHMSTDKIQMRSKGKLLPIIKQPTRGRRNQGGLKIGEMEKDSLISHGLSLMVKESFMNRGGATCELDISKYNGLINNNFEHNIKKIKVPVTTKTFIQEMQSLGIATRLVV